MSTLRVVFAFSFLICAEGLLVNEPVNPILKMPKLVHVKQGYSFAVNLLPKDAKQKSQPFGLFLHLTF
jgi:hypothetical protein